MGRRRWTNRLTVEECPLYLCATAFNREGTFDLPPGAVTTVTWPRCGGRIECHLAGYGSPKLRIIILRQWARSDVPVEAQSISVTTTRPHLGGIRYWFRCECSRRAGRLYLPPGEKQFRCRRCYDLIHRSAQRHDQRKYDLARNLFAIDKALGSKKIGRALLGVSATGLRLGWERKGRFC